MDCFLLSMWTLYDQLAWLGEWWQFVRDSAKEAAIIPIEADQELIQQRLHHSCDAGREVQAAQEALFEEYERMRSYEEHEFIEQILTKKQQQIKAEWLKKNRTGVLLPSRNNTTRWLTAML